MARTQRPSSLSKALKNKARHQATALFSASLCCFYYYSNARSAQMAWQSWWKAVKKQNKQKKKPPKNSSCNPFTLCAWELPKLQMELIFVIARFEVTRTFLGNCKQFVAYQIFHIDHQFCCPLDGISAMLQQTWIIVQHVLLLFKNYA